MPTHKNRVKMSVSGTPGTGAITLGSAPSGYQSLASAYGGNATIDVLIADGTAWEVARGCTYTHIGTTLTRGTLEESSTGSVLSLTSSAVVSEILTAARATRNEIALQAVTPGGRLTLTSGTPVTTSDVTAATSVYYTPFVHDVIVLWDGSDWVPVTFTEQTLAIGTVTSGLPYDVFGYLSSGALAVEKLAWTNGTTRATAVSLQGGRYCKSGDKTRIYLGSFYSTSTTTTEDSATKRFVFNAYNRQPRRLRVHDSTTSWSYGTAAWRAANNSTANRVEIFAGLESMLDLTVVGLNSHGGASGTGLASIGEDSTSSIAAEIIGGYSGNVGSGSGGAMPAVARLTKSPSNGYHYYQWLEWSEVNPLTFYSGLSTHKSGITGSWLA